MIISNKNIRVKPKNYKKNRNELYLNSLQNFRVLLNNFLFFSIDLNINLDILIKPLN